MMRTINKELFYHIARKGVSRGGNWKEGALYFIGDNENYYYQRLMNQGFPAKEENQLIPSEMGNFDSHQERIKQLESQVRFYQLWIQENLLEKIRKEHFPDRPSRFRAMWVIPSEKKAMAHWLPKLKAPNAQIMKLELSGTLHRAPQKFLEALPSSATFKQKNAFAYWLGNSGEMQMDDECLFQGFMRVIDIING